MRGDAEAASDYAALALAHAIKDIAVALLEDEPASGNSGLVRVPELMRPRHRWVSRGRDRLYCPPLSRVGTPWQLSRLADNAVCVCRRLRTIRRCTGLVCAS